MTPRERLLAILQGKQPDQVPWFGDLDYWASARIGRGEVPEDFKTSDAYIEWHRDLGVGFYLQGYFPFIPTIENCEVKVWWEGNRRYRQITTPKGMLRECWLYLTDSFCEAPVEHLLKTVDDLPAMRYMYENTHYQADYAFAEQRLSQVGEMGVVLCYLPKSPFMHLVALEAGIENVTFIALQSPDEFAATLDVMAQAHRKAARLALHSPAEVLMIPENLSAEVVGRRFFEHYMRGYQEEWIQKIAEAGKYSFIHMDGTLRGLLREECSTRVSVLEALTPQPVGDLRVEDWADFADESPTILWGGLPGIYFTDLVTDEEFDRHVKAVLAIMRQEPRYVLGVADQVPPAGLPARVKRVRELVDEFGVYA
ncbi:hypothetical protein GF339_12990 [candidate division KSB3 bacterium]|uniref:Uroporphyrinogen decarboxylase (URO-D) domain-containing protein n=1 Tax=candidate division KSB3 bacterium TaxID=2044937 RepID=A0A9D5Q656_9BACT|nr:hypothetical protein [candidate division KSB3 bacterium]MBD3325499.1 hypothetical protein [candidate division KSB3 bacterium]